MDDNNSYTPSKRRDFTIIQNKLIRDSSLSCKAFKLLCIGLSHDGSWNFKKWKIAQSFKEKEHTIDEAMKELKAIGYLHTIPQKSSDGKMAGHKWFWFEDPISGEEFKKRFRKGDFPEFGDFRQSENHPDLRRTSSKKTNLKKKNNNGPESENLPQPTEPPRKERAAPVVVVSPLLDKKPIDDSLKQKISQKYKHAEIKQAILAVREMKYIDNYAASLQTALKERWVPKKNAKDQEKANREYLHSLQHWDGCEAGHYIVQVHPNLILFRHSCTDGSKDVPCLVEKIGFISKVKSFFDRNLPKIETSNACEIPA